MIMKQMAEIYSYKVVHNNLITLVCTARPKQKAVVLIQKSTSLKNFACMVIKRHTNLSCFSNKGI
jgi:hypothetical protein